VAEGNRQFQQEKEVGRASGRRKQAEPVGGEGRQIQQEKEAGSQREARLRLLFVAKLVPLDAASITSQIIQYVLECSEVTRELDSDF
jgi:hypothetical protein